MSKVSRVSKAPSVVKSEVVSIAKISEAPIKEKPEEPILGNGNPPDEDAITVATSAVEAAPSQ